MEVLGTLVRGRLKGIKVLLKILLGLPLRWRSLYQLLPTVLLNYGTPGVLVNQIIIALQHWFEMNCIAVHVEFLGLLPLKLACVPFQMHTTQTLMFFHGMNMSQLLCLVGTMQC